MCTEWMCFGAYWMMISFVLKYHRIIYLIVDVCVLRNDILTIVASFRPVRTLEVGILL